MTASLLGQRDPRYIVVYLDGGKSGRMDRRTALDYAEIFGGKVECVEPKLVDKIRDCLNAQERESDD